MTEHEALHFNNINKYDDVSRVGNGAYGTVYRARDTKSGQVVALKQIRIRTSEEGIPMSTIREIAFLTHLQKFEHPNIVKLLDVCMGRRTPEETRLYLVFEFIEQDLSRFLLEYPEPTLPPHIVKDIMKQLLLGIDFLHTKLVTHRDIKPQNILVDRGLCAKLCDFGLARLFENAMALTSIVVTLWYRAPEVLLKSSYGLAVDLWSCGCIFAELSTRKPLFAGQSEMDQLHLMFDLIGMPPAELWPVDAALPYDAFPVAHRKCFRTILPELSDDGLDLIQKMLTFDPKSRITAEQALSHPYFQTTDEQGDQNQATNHTQ